MKYILKCDIIEIMILYGGGYMSFSAFSFNENYGMLQSKTDIKLLICYILSSVKSGISKNDIISILQDNRFASYFDAVDAFSDLYSNGNIKKLEEDQELYTVTDSGKMISEQLGISLPVTIRENALSAALNILSKTRLKKENSVTIEKNDHGYTVLCNISGGEMDLMSFSLYVPDKIQANMVKENFQKDPQSIYHVMLALLTKDKEFVEEALKNIK